MLEPLRPTPMTKTGREIETVGTDIGSSDLRVRSLTLGEESTGRSEDTGDRAGTTSPRPKVILLSYHYPPSQAVGGLRARKVVDALRSAGYPVHMITGRLPGEDERIRHEEQGLVVETVRVWPNPRWWWISIKKRLTENSPSAPSPSEMPTTRVNPTGRTPPAWKRWISALLWTPDDKQGFIIPATWAAIRASFRERVLIFSTVPPFSAHLAGLLASFLTGGALITEFRDPWTDSQFRMGDRRAALTTRLERWLERRCLERSALVVSVSTGIDRKLAAKVAATDRGKFIVVRNGIPRLLPHRTAIIPGKPFRIVHVGSFYHRRDPFPFLEAVGSLVRERGMTSADLSIQFIGHCREYSGVSVARRAAELGLDDILTLKDWVPHEEAGRRIESADLVLLLAQGQPDQIPNKLYDYLGVRVPILALVDEAGESAEMLRLVGGHYVVTQNEDRDAISRALTTALGCGPTPPMKPGEDVAQWTVDRQMAELVHAVDAISRRQPDH